MKACIGRWFSIFVIVALAMISVATWAPVYADPAPSLRVVVVTQPAPVPAHRAAYKPTPKPVPVPVHRAAYKPVPKPAPVHHPHVNPPDHPVP